MRATLNLLRSSAKISRLINVDDAKTERPLSTATTGRLMRVGKLVRRSPMLSARINTHRRLCSAPSRAGYRYFRPRFARLAAEKEAIKAAASAALCHHMQTSARQTNCHVSHVDFPFSRRRAGSRSRRSRRAKQKKKKKKRRRRSKKMELETKRALRLQPPTIPARADPDARLGR